MRHVPRRRGLRGHDVVQVERVKSYQPSTSACGVHLRELLVVHVLLIYRQRPQLGQPTRPM